MQVEANLVLKNICLIQFSSQAAHFHEYDETRLYIFETDGKKLFACQKWSKGRGNPSKKNKLDSTAELNIEINAQSSRWSNNLPIRVPKHPFRFVFYFKAAFFGWSQIDLIGWARDGCYAKPMENCQKTASACDCKRFINVADWNFSHSSPASTAKSLCLQIELLRKMAPLPCDPNWWLNFPSSLVRIASLFRPRMCWSESVYD